MVIDVELKRGTTSYPKKSTSIICFKTGILFGRVARTNAFAAMFWGVDDGDDNDDDLMSC